GAGAADLLELESHGLRRAAARAHPEHHATRSQLLQGEDGARRHGHVTRVRDGHPGPELDTPGAEHAGGEGDPQLAADEMRVRHPYRLEAERLGELDLSHDLGNGLGGKDAEVESPPGIIAEASARDSRPHGIASDAEGLARPLRPLLGWANRHPRSSDPEGETCASASSMSTSSRGPGTRAASSSCSRTPSTRSSWAIGLASTTPGRSSITSWRSIRTPRRPKCFSPPPPSAPSRS